MKRLNYFLIVAGAILLLLNVYDSYTTNDWNYGSIVSNVLIIFGAVMTLRDAKKLKS